MSNAAVWSMDGASEGVELTFSLFEGASRESPRAAPERAARPRPAEARPRAEKPFQRLLGTLSLADLNEYRQAAGREPELDARAMRALHASADRFFPVREDESGGRFLRNAYLKYMSETIDLAEVANGPDLSFGRFE